MTSWAATARRTPGCVAPRRCWRAGPRTATWSRICGRARAAAARLGAAPLAAAVAAMAVRAGVRLDDEAAPVAPASDVLTPRERSVLALVADGRTNRQVGAELYISEKTVSVHLSRVMAKLGASSRTEAVTHRLRPRPARSPRPPRRQSLGAPRLGPTARRAEFSHPR